MKSVLIFAGLWTLGCGGAPSASDLTPQQQGPLCESLVTQFSGDFACRAEDIRAGHADAAAARYLVELEFAAEGKLVRYSGLRMDGALTDARREPPACLVNAIRNLKLAGAPSALRVAASVEYQPKAKPRAALHRGRCALVVAPVGP
jgi:hypothetical protein